MPGCTGLSDIIIFHADTPSNASGKTTVDGHPLKLVATKQYTENKKRKKIYVYHIQGTNLIVFSTRRNSTKFLRMAVRSQNKHKFYETFAVLPVTEKEQKWLDRYDYVLTR